MRDSGERRPHVLILNVDDLDATRHASSRVLRQAGFDVLEASTGREALEMMSRAPDLVLLDVNLPDMDGFEVCRRIKEAPATAATSVLYISAMYRETADRVRGLEAGADAYLIQPVEPRELVATVNALLRARQVEAAVRRSEERFRSLVEATAQVIFTTDAQGRMVEPSASWLALTGQTPAAVLGLGWMDAFHPDDHARAKKEWEHSLAEGLSFHSECRVRLTDGSWHYYSVRAAPVRERDGTVREWIGVLSDIDARRRGQEYQRLLAEAGVLLSSSLDAEVTLRRVARLAVPALADWCAVDILQESGRIQRVATSGRRGEGERQTPEPGSAGAMAREAAAAAIRTGEPEIVRDAGDAELAAAAGHPEHLAMLRQLGVRSLIIVPLRARGSTIGALTLATSESRRAYGEAELATAEELARRAAMAVDNARLYTAALSASQAKSDFLAVMSHELRTPLNAIIGYADLLSAGISGPVTRQQTEQIGRIIASAHHLLELINDVLTFSRVEAGREEVNAEPVDLAALVRESAAMVRPLASKKGLDFQVVAPADFPANTDAGKVRQIMLNLLSNAVKFTDRGSVRLELEPEGDTVRLSVRDTGIGIPPEKQERIFDPFRQVERADARRAGGTGLGLSVSRHLARLLGGDITVESRPGSGSTFTVRLPRDAARTGS